MPKIKIEHMSIVEEEYTKNANALLKKIDDRIKKLQQKKRDLLNTMHIAAIYFKNQKEKSHKPSQEELEDLFGDGQ
jgi:hypothetical protein